jgi:hypothetical protein
VLVLLGALIALTPLAQTGRTRPGSAAYDDGEYDDVVLLVTGALHAVQGAPLPEFLPVSEVVALVLAMAPAVPREPEGLFEAGRAPPFARVFPRSRATDSRG